MTNNDRSWVEWAARKMTDEVPPAAIPPFALIALAAARLSAERLGVPGIPVEVVTVDDARQLGRSCRDWLGAEVSTR
jgi:hypothetical protein